MNFYFNRIHLVFLKLFMDAIMDATMDATATEQYRTIEIVVKYKYCCINLLKSLWSKLTYFGTNPLI